MYIRMELRWHVWVAVLVCSLGLSATADANAASPEVVRALLEEAKVHRDDIAAGERWIAACDNNGTFEDCLSALAWHYHRYIDALRRLRNSEKWGGPKAVDSTVNERKRSLFATYQHMRDTYPEKIASLSEFYGDIEFWLRAREANAIAMYYLALRSDTTFSDEIFRKLRSAFGSMVRNAPHQDWEFQIRENYLFPYDIPRVRDEDIEAWKAALAVLDGDHPADFLESEDARVQSIVKLLDERVDVLTGKKPDPVETQQGSVIRYVGNIRIADDPPETYEQAMAYLGSRSPAHIELGIDAIREMMRVPQTPQGKIATERVGEWHRALSDAKRYDAIAELSLLAIVNQPEQQNQVRWLLEQRALALRDARDHTAALATAKSLYNVAEDVSRAASVFRRVLPLVQRRDVQAHMFKLMEEIPKDLKAQEGLMAQIMAEVQPTEALMKDVKVDPAHYESAIRQYQQRDDFEGLMTLGTLQLLADKPQNAMGAYTRAWRKAETEAQQRELANGMTCAIRARDGVEASHRFIRSMTTEGIQAAVERVSASQ